MIVGVLTVDLFLLEGGSLKAKRKVISSIKSKLDQKFNIAIAEVGYLDKWQRSQLGICTISNEVKHIDQVFSHLMNQLYQDTRIEVVAQEKQLY